jgi:4'-phosphopantetheinyl transferase EntD
MPGTDVGASTPRPVAPLGMELTGVLAALAPSGVRVGWRRIDPDDLVSLHDVERLHVARAVDVRRWEFASGRALLRELIGAAVAIPSRPDRTAAFPPGWHGSLAHDRQVVVAAATDDRAVTALGIDVEPATTLSVDLARVVLRADEVGLDAHLAFTLKEAAYKAWSTLGGRLLEHHDVRLSVAADRFIAEVLDDGAVFTGRWARAAGRWLALVVVHNDPGRG